MIATLVMLLTLAIFLMSIVTEMIVMWMTTIKNSNNNSGNSVNSIRSNSDSGNNRIHRNVSHTGKIVNNNNSA